MIKQTSLKKKNKHDQIQHSPKGRKAKQKGIGGKSGAEISLQQKEKGARAAAKRAIKPQYIVQGAMIKAGWKKAAHERAIKVKPNGKSQKRQMEKQIFFKSGPHFLPPCCFFQYNTERERVQEA